MEIKNLISSSTKELSGVTPTALLDCELLLAFILAEKKEYLLAHGDEEVSGEDEKLFLSYLERVKMGEPIAYIVGEKEFFGLDFFVDSRVLIPRPETEFLVERALEFLEEKGGRKIIDVGTGSGCIAVSIARNLPGNEEIQMVDISEEALAVARMNAERHEVEDRVQLFQSDLLEEADDYYDVIVANLPYIGEVKHRFVAENTEKFEPAVALFGGEDGLVLYKKMFQQIRDRNIRFRLLLGEFGFDQAGDMEKLLNNYFEQNWEIFDDLAGIPRFFIVNLHSC